MLKKETLTIGTMAIVLCALQALSAAAADRVDQARARVERRISICMASGQLSSRQIEKFKLAMERLVAKEKLYRNSGGRLTASEANHLTSEFDALNTTVANEKRHKQVATSPLWPWF